MNTTPTQDDLSETIKLDELRQAAERVDAVHPGRGLKILTEACDAGIARCTLTVKMSGERPTIRVFPEVRGADPDFNYQAAVDEFIRQGVPFLEYEPGTERQQRNLDRLRAGLSFGDLPDGWTLWYDQFCCEDKDGDDLADYRTGVAEFEAVDEAIASAQQHLMSIGYDASYEPIEVQS
jgi:hypothetical protein